MQESIEDAAEVEAPTEVEAPAEVAQAEPALPEGTMPWLAAAGGAEATGGAAWAAAESEPARVDAESDGAASEAHDFESEVHPAVAAAEAEFAEVEPVAEVDQVEESVWTEPAADVVGPEEAEPVAEVEQVEESGWTQSAADAVEPEDAEPVAEESEVESAEVEPVGAGRRTSEFWEVHDGGFGMGSAAPLPDRAMPLGHAVQAYRDTMTYRSPGMSGYDSVEPDVWFYNDEVAEQCGFTRSVTQD